jgi:regulator of replication initiation timing
MALPLPAKKTEPKKEGAPPGAGPQPVEAAHPPQVDGFKLKGKLKKGKLKDLASTLRSISFLEIAPEKEALNVIYVESRDIDKNPYLFSIVKLREDEVEVMYTIPSEISPRKRKVDVIRYLLNILSLIEADYEVDHKTLYQLIETAITQLSSSVTMDYTKLFTNYDSLKKEADDYKRKVDRLTEQSQALSTSNYELKAENDELRLKVAELSSLSENALKAKLQEWIIEHNGSINITEFAKLHKVAEAKVEETLNRLVSEGYLEVVR